MSFKQYKFQGASAAGAITVTGLAVGDRVVAVLGQTPAQNFYAPVVGTAFETAITVADQIQQAATDLEEYTFVVVVERLDLASVAATGSVQGDAAALSLGHNTVSAADATKGVILPAAVIGKEVWVYNEHATNGLKVYPNTSDDINDGSANAAITMEGKGLAYFVALDATTWAATYVVNA